MKAFVYREYGTPDVLKMCEVDPPVLRDDDVLVRVHATSINAGDWHLVGGAMFAVRLYQGLFKPKRPVLGHDVSGVVEAVGEKVTRFKPGDEVFGECDDAGGFAELIRVPESGLASKPAGLTHEQAATMPTAGITALQGLRDKGKLQAGHKVLINGAAGGVGHFAVQIAKALGAEVTGVCRTDKLELVRALGADHVVDYKQTDFTTLDERYDLILDIVGKHSLADCKRMLTPGGTYVAVAGAPSRSLRIVAIGGKRMVAYIASPNAADLEVLSELHEADKLKPAIARSFPFSEIPAALHFFGAESVGGKLAIKVR